MRDLQLRQVVTVAGVALVACRARAPQQAEAPTHHAAHFTYAGANGPEHWAQLDSAWAACATGRQQSPVDLADATRRHDAPIEFHYRPSALRLVNNGHTVQDDYDPGSYILVGGARFDVVQFHFHAPGEHHVTGQAFPAELHVVHRSAAGGLAVIGVLLEAGAANRAYQVILDSLPGEEGPERTMGAMLNVADLLPVTHGTYRYAGSLTTPPCSEGVQWLVMDTPVTLSAAQLASLTRVIHDNNRPIQPLNGRPLVEVSER